LQALDYQRPVKDGQVAAGRFKVVNFGRTILRMWFFKGFLRQDRKSDLAGMP